jgi:hypothetical protein
VKRVVLSLGLLISSGLVFAAAGGGGAADHDEGDERTVYDADDDRGSVGAMSTVCDFFGEGASSEVVNRVIAKINQWYRDFLQYNSAFIESVKAADDISEKLALYRRKEDEFDNKSHKILEYVIYVKNDLMGKHFLHIEEDEDEDVQREREDSIPEIEALNKIYDAVDKIRNTFDSRKMALKESIETAKRMKRQRKNSI